MSNVVDPNHQYDAMEFELRIDEIVLSRWHVRSTGNNKFHQKLKFPLYLKYLNSDVSLL